MSIPRKLAPQLLALRGGYPAVLVTGPRQAGKTTFVLDAREDDKPYVNLESPLERAAFRDDPHGFFDRYPEGAILDEVQNEPDLLSYLQVRIDAEPQMGRWILTGSQQVQLQREASQSLAGRVALLELLPFSLSELKGSPRQPRSLDQAVLVGGYPPLFDEARKLEPAGWLENYLTTFVHRDVEAVLHSKNPRAFERFLRVCATRTGQEVNQSRLAGECGVDQKTIANWLEVLEICYVIKLVRSHHRNFGKRIVKRPKLFFLDSGLACRLLHILDVNQLAAHPQRGALFETWCFGELFKGLTQRGIRDALWYWRTSDGIEIDFLIERGNSLTPIEVKARATPESGAASAIRKLRALNERDAGVTVEKGLVIYGGSEARSGSEADFVPWFDIDSALEHLL